MIQIPASNPWVAVNRFRKVIALSMAIDAALIVFEVGTFTRAAHLYVSSMNDEAWRIACEHAHCPPASVETRSAVIDLYAERVARAA